AFDGLKLENFLVVLSEVRRTLSPNGDMIDPTGPLPAFLKVTLAHVGHPFLREVKLVVIRIVGSKAGKRDVTLALNHENVGIKLLQPIPDGLNVFDFKAEVIQPCGKAGLALQ